MASRTDLHTKLKNILGSSYVYYQPPESIKLNYPCFIYEKTDHSSTKADNTHYMGRAKYSVTYISKTPDSLDPMNLLKIPYCTFDRRYVADNLYHDVYEVYF